MTLLENLWYGNVHPVEEFLEGNKEYKNLLRIAAKDQERLNDAYPPSKPNCLRNTNQRQRKCTPQPKWKRSPTASGLASN